MWLPGLIRVPRLLINRAWRRNDLQRAERIAGWYLRWRPGDPQAWALLANQYFHQRKMNEALEVLRKGLELHGEKEPDLSWMLSLALVSQREFAEAERVLKQQAKATPDSRLPYLGLLRVATRQKRWAEAERLVQMTDARTAANDYGGKYELALEMVFVPGARERIIELLTDATKGLPRFPPAHVLLGVILEASEPASAERYLEHARRHWLAPMDFDDFVRHTREGIEPS